MVDWAGLEIRSLSQDRGFESLSLLETKRVPFGGPFCFNAEWDENPLLSQQYIFAKNFHAL